MGIIALILNIIYIITGTNTRLHTLLAVVVFGITAWEFIDFIETKKEIDEFNKKLEVYKNGGKRK